MANVRSLCLQVVSMPCQPPFSNRGLDSGVSIPIKYKAHTKAKIAPLSPESWLPICKSSVIFLVLFRQDRHISEPYAFVRCTADTYICSVALHVLREKVTVRCRCLPAKDETNMCQESGAWNLVVECIRVIGLEVSEEMARMVEAMLPELPQSDSLFIPVENEKP